MNDIQRYELALWLSLVVIVISAFVIIFVNDTDIVKQKPIYGVALLWGIYGVIKSTKKLDEAHRDEIETYYKLAKKMNEGDVNGQEGVTNTKSE